MIQRPDGPPNWETQETEVVCPLCAYNLRGLTEPRCPECGYQFIWSELLEAKRNKHPYLFEHHRERPIWSFFKTMFGGLRPKRFWTSIHPAHATHMHRLIAYWIGTLVLTSVWAIGVAVQLWVQFRTMSPTLGPSLFGFSGIVWSILLWFMWVMLVTVSWVGATLLALMIFRISMRRAKVRTVHVLRCVLYSFDAVVWAALAIMFWQLAESMPGFTVLIGSDFDDEMAIAIPAALFLTVSYRLYRAYRHYLQFDHPFWTILATQLIVIMAALAVALNLNRLF
jgi:hypothetical protein